MPGPLVAAAPYVATGLGALFSYLMGKKQMDAQAEAQQNAQPYQDAMTALLRQQLAQSQRTDPLHEALVTMAQRRLPVWARSSTPTAPAAPDPAPRLRAMPRETREGRY